MKRETNKDVESDIRNMTGEPLLFSAISTLLIGRWQTAEKQKRSITEGKQTQLGLVELNVLS